MDLKQKACNIDRIRFKPRTFVDVSRRTSVMKRNFTLASLLALSIVSTVAFGATDFSGTWVLDPAKSELPLTASAAKALNRTVTITIKQTATTLTIERKTDNRSEAAAYKLDGSPSINKTPSGGEVKSTSTWAGATLVTKSSMVSEGTTVQSTDVRSLADGGKTMILEVTRQTPRGETKQKLVYNRK